MLANGQKAPDFELPDQDGRKHTLKSLLKDGPLILYFYPADFTPGCTKEACSFRDLHQELLKAKLRVVGVSPQDVASHRKFADQHGLNFTLLTLILSMQASYAAPLILLAQNRQDDRDRVKFEQDRVRAERNLADTEYLAREVVALRLALEEMATRDFVRDELRDLLQEFKAELSELQPAAKATPTRRASTRK